MLYQLRWWFRVSICLELLFTVVWYGIIAALALAGLMMAIVRGDIDRIAVLLETLIWIGAVFWFAGLISRDARRSTQELRWQRQTRMAGRGLPGNPATGPAPVARDYSGEDVSMPPDQRLVSERFPRSSQYHPEWVLANASGGANSLWVTEWLTEALDLRPGMRVLDLGCGRASSSIFLRREFGVQVWATDLWFSASENLQRIRDAGVEEGVFPIHADARSLPFAAEFFDAILCIDSFIYYGTDDLYLSYLARFVKPGGTLAIAGAGLMQEIDGPLPDHLQEWWTQDLWSLHSAAWWRRHWERTGIMDIELADDMPDGWQLWLDWHKAVAPDNAAEIKALEADRGKYLGYVRLVGRRQGQVKLEEPVVSVPAQYTKKPLLRSQDAPDTREKTVV